MKTPNESARIYELEHTRSDRWAGFHKKSAEQLARERGLEILADELKP